MEQEPAAISLPFDSFLATELERLSDEEFWEFAFGQASKAGHPVHLGHLEEYAECVLDASGHRCWLALDALSQALSPPQHLALLPAMPSWMIGLLAWHGETLAVIDFAAYLADSQQAVIGQLSKGKLIIVNDISSKNCSFPTLALFVADFGQTTTIASEQIQAGNLTEITAVSSNWLAPTRLAVIRGSYDNAPVLDVSALLVDIVERIGIAALDE